jgi:hypothetical protein
MSEPIFHVVFGSFVGENLVRHLAEHGRPDRVIALADNLSFGPIDNPSALPRSRWVIDQLGESDWEEWSAENAEFIARSHPADVKVVAWFSRRSSSEYAGFLWWLSHLHDRPCLIIDVTDFLLSEAGGAPTATAMLSGSDFEALLDTEVILQPREVARCQELWKRLEKENAPLRRIGSSGTLESVGIDYFDALLLACSTSEWRRRAYIVGEALVSFWDEGFYQTGDLVLFARLRFLAEAGRLEWRGNLLQRRKCELRLPSGEGPPQSLSR